MPMTPPDIILMLRLKLYSSLSKRTCPRCLHGSNKIYSELITLSLKLWSLAHLLTSMTFTSTLKILAVTLRWIGRFPTRNQFRHSYREFIPRRQLLNEYLALFPWTLWFSGIKRFYSPHSEYCNAVLVGLGTKRWTRRCYGYLLYLKNSI